MELNQKSSNFSDLTCLFNNGLSLVTSKDSLINLLNLCDSAVILDNGKGSGKLEMR